MVNEKKLQRQRCLPKEGVDWNDGDDEDDGEVTQKNYSLKSSLKIRVIIKTETKGKTTLA